MCKTTKEFIDDCVENVSKLDRNKLISRDSN